MTRHHTYAQELLEAGADIEACDTLHKSLFTTRICVAFSDTLLHMHTGTTRGRSRHRSARHVNHLAFYHTYICGILWHFTTHIHRYYSRQEQTSRRVTWMCHDTHLNMPCPSYQSFPPTWNWHHDSSARDMLRESILTTHTFGVLNDTTRYSTYIRCFQCHITTHALNATLLPIHTGTTRGRSRHQGVRHVE